MTRVSTFTGADRVSAIARFKAIRARTRGLFDMIDPGAYHERPIALRNPIVFYEGHLSAFAVNTLLKRALGEPGIDARMEEIFARGIDPESEASATARGNPIWPERAAVLEFTEEADRRLTFALAHADLDRSDVPLLKRGQSVFTILEHEEMHQETLAYMWHQLPQERKKRPDSKRSSDGPAARARSRDGHRIEIPGGRVTLGTSLYDEPFAWDNEVPPVRVEVEPFTIDAGNVTNAAFMEFVNAGGYRQERWWNPDAWAWRAGSAVSHPPFWTRRDESWHWRGMFETIELPAHWPVYVSWAEASAYARWAGARLPTESELHRAAFGTAHGVERRFPWGDEEPDPVRGNFGFDRWDPVDVGSRPAGASAFGVEDLVGNGWEWTSTQFAGFPGFEPLPSYPEYSADFFDGRHYVLKGASPVTAMPLLRRGFRNWFRPEYPYVYATFRCVR